MTLWPWRFCKRKPTRRNYYLENRHRYLERYQCKREQLIEYQLARYRRQRKRLIQYQADYFKKNKRRILAGRNPEVWREWNREVVVRLTDYYLRSMLRSAGIKPTPSAIKHKRTTLQVWRLQHLFKALAAGPALQRQFRTS